MWDYDNKTSENSNCIAGEEKKLGSLNVAAPLNICWNWLVESLKNCKERLYKQQQGNGDIEKQELPANQENEAKKKTRIRIEISEAKVQEATRERTRRYGEEEKAGFIEYMKYRDQEEKRSNLSWYAEYQKVSRSTLYNVYKKYKDSLKNEKPGPKKKEEAEKLAEKLEQKLREKMEECEVLEELLKEQQEKWENHVKERLIRTILEAAVTPMRPVEIRRLIETAFGIKISKSKIKRIIGEYSEKAREVLKEIGIEHLVEFLGVDEIFIGSKPVLVGVDLNSFAVVLSEKKDSRDHKVWESLLNLFPCVKLVVSDQAKGITKAVYLCGDMRHQFDLFHFKRDVGRFVRHLEAKAYGKIAVEYKLQDELEKAEGEQDRSNLREQYNKAKEETVKAIDIYDQAESDFDKMFSALDLFDSSGNFKDISKSLRDVERTAVRLERLSDNLEKDSKDQKRMRNLSRRAQDPKLLLYLVALREQLLDIIIRWQSPSLGISRNKALKVLAEYWYWKNASKKQRNKMRGAIKELKVALEVRRLQLAMANFSEVFQKVSTALSNTFRASSLVESYNSQVRMCQQVKKGLGNNFLALLALKWNMTEFDEGKRKGKSPYQILGVHLEHSNWLDLLTRN